MLFRRKRPVHAFTRAGTLLRITKAGLQLVEDGGDQDRVMLGFWSVVVFGRAITNALQNLRTFDADRFNKWYAPWEADMRADPLMLWFYRLRTLLLKDITPLIGYVLYAGGLDTPPIGTIEPNQEPPDTHRGEPIEDKSTVSLCRLYVTYLEEMFLSAAEVSWAVEDEFTVKHGWGGSSDE